MAVKRRKLWMMRTLEVQKINDSSRCKSRKVDFVERRVLKQTGGEYVEGRNLTFVIHEPLCRLIILLKLLNQIEELVSQSPRVER